LNADFALTIKDGFSLKFGAILKNKIENFISRYGEQLNEKQNFPFKINNYQRFAAVSGFVNDLVASSSEIKCSAKHAIRSFAKFTKYSNANQRGFRQAALDV
jgi:hypothetical protein